MESSVGKAAWRRRPSELLGGGQGSGSRCNCRWSAGRTGCPRGEDHVCPSPIICKCRDRTTKMITKDQGGSEGTPVGGTMSDGFDLEKASDFCIITK